MKQTIGARTFLLDELTKCRVPDGVARRTEATYFALAMLRFAYLSVSNDPKKVENFDECIQSVLETLPDPPETTAPFAERYKEYGDIIRAGKGVPGELARRLILRITGKDAFSQSDMNLVLFVADLTEANVSALKDRGVR